MPLYEYKCDACGHQFEVIQKFSDPPVEKCPKCAGAVTKLISSSAIQFRGSGWYVTDYAKKGGSGSSGGDRKAPASTEKDTSSPAASTPATGTSATTAAASSTKDS
jgi:putative FmdB family regulatory protein